MKFHLQQPGKRYTCKEPPLWMRINMSLHGHCWCGKPKSLWGKYQRKYCCSEHGSWHYWHFREYWGSVRDNIRKRDNNICQMCKKVVDDKDFDCDHIVAISLGGEMFNEDNLRTLCSECHKIKTKEDFGKLALKKRLNKVNNNDTL